MALATRKVRFGSDSQKARDLDGTKEVTFRELARLDGTREVTFREVVLHFEQDCCTLKTA